MEFVQALHMVTRAVHSAAARNFLCVKGVGRSKVVVRVMLARHYPPTLQAEVYGAQPLPERTEAAMQALAQGGIPPVRAVERTGVPYEGAEALLIKPITVEQLSVVGIDLPLLDTTYEATNRIVRWTLRRDGVSRPILLFVQRVLRRWWRR